MAATSCTEINYQLIISNGSDQYLVEPLDGVQLTRWIDCVPSKLIFKVPNDAVLNFTEGNSLTFSVNKIVVFKGFVFEKSRDKENIISVTAYDQMRYLKNKDALFYKDKTATELIQMLCDDCGLKVGSLANTQYKIPKRAEQNKTYADMIMFALTQTLIHAHNLYHLYDDAGQIVLKHIDGMKTDVLIDTDVMENYQYRTSIDKDTYNAVKVVKEVKGANNSILAKVAYAKDDGNIKLWGRLQYYIKADDHMSDVLGRAKDILKLKNRKTREISLRGVIGDVNVRGGSMVFLDVNFGDVKIKNYMMVTMVNHHFSQNCHTMDLSILYPEQGKEATGTWKDDNLGSFGTANMTATKGVIAGYDAYKGVTMSNGTNGCVEAVCKMGSYYSPFLADEAKAGTAEVDVLQQHASSAGVAEIAFSPENVEAGDVIIYDTDAHAVIANGTGGYYGNSSSQNMVTEGDNYYEMYSGEEKMTPTSIIKTSRG